MLYADDVLISCGGAKRGLSNLLELFSSYQAYSGQAISKHRSTFYVGKCSVHKVNFYERLLGFKKSHPPLII